MLAPGGFFASNTSTLPISGLAAGQRAARRNSSASTSSARCDKMKLVEIIRGKQTDDETVARAFDYVQALGKIADRRQRFARLLHQPRVRHLRHGRRGDARRRHSGAGGRARRRSQAGMPVGPLAVLDETALSLSVHVLDQTRADFARRGQAPTSPRRASCWSSAWSRSSTAPAAPAGGGFYDYPAEKGAKKSSGRS